MSRLLQPPHCAPSIRAPRQQSRPDDRPPPVLLQPHALTHMAIRRECMCRQRALCFAAHHYPAQVSPPPCIRPPPLCRNTLSPSCFTGTCAACTNGACEPSLHTTVHRSPPAAGRMGRGRAPPTAGMFCCTILELSRLCPHRRQKFCNVVWLLSPMGLGLLNFYQMRDTHTNH